jgi:hypothetical protein
MTGRAQAAPGRMHNLTLHEENGRRDALSTADMVGNSTCGCQKPGHRL